MSKNPKPTDGAAGPQLNLPQAVEVAPTDELICPLLSGGMVMAMAQVSRPALLTQSPQQQVIQQPVRYHMACIKEKCAWWDAENTHCVVQNIGLENE